MQLVWIVILFLLLMSTGIADSCTNPHYSGTLLLDQNKDVLFEQFSPYTYTLELLQAKNKFPKQSLVFGGWLETDLQYWHGDRIFTIAPVRIYQSGSGFYFTLATFDVMANLNDYSTVFFSGADSLIGQGPPDGNYYYIPRAFIVFGNLDKFPVYTAFGINSIPFGVFSGSGSWDIPLTSDYFNPQQAPLLHLGFNKKDWNLNVGIFNDEINYQNHFVYSFYYSKTFKSISLNIGAGYLTNIQTNITGNPTVSTNRRRSRRESSNMGNILDINGSLTYKLFSLSGEYLFANKKVGFNKHPPQGLGVTLTYTPVVCGKDLSLGISHSKTLYLHNIPTPLSGADASPLTEAGLKNSWAASISRYVYKKLINIGLDAERDVTYSNKKTYTYTLDVTAYL